MDNDTNVHMISWLLGHLSTARFAITVLHSLDSTADLLQPCLLPSLSRQLVELQASVSHRSWPRLFALTSLTYLYLLNGSAAHETGTERVGLEPPGPCLPVLRQLRLLDNSRPRSLPLEQLLCGCNMPQLTRLSIETRKSPLTAPELKGVAVLSTLHKCVSA